MTLSNELVGQSTVFGGVCHVLARVGTRRGGAGIEQLARSGKLGDPTYESPAHIAWVAALAIAQRDAWDGSDAWLARLIDEKLPLVTNLDPSPELGATAAATLLERHGARRTPLVWKRSARAWPSDSGWPAIVSTTRPTARRCSPGGSGSPPPPIAPHLRRSPVNRPPRPRRNRASP